MKILIIGGAGYIGSHVTREFIDNGYECIVFDNFSTGLKENIFPESKIIEGDIKNYSEILNAIKDVYAVIHLAAHKNVGESMENLSKYTNNNIVGTLNILNAMIENKVKRIIFSSSAAVYGEPQYLPIDEKHPTNPINFYGFTKLEIEQLLKWYNKLKGIKFAALRYFNAAGYDIRERITGKEKYTSNLIPIIMEVASEKRKELQIYGNDYDTPDGTALRDYIHVNDLATGHLKALEYLEFSDKIIANLGTGVTYSVKEVLDLTNKVTNKNLPFKIVNRRWGDPVELSANANLANQLLNWKAQYSDLQTIIETSWRVYGPK